MDRCQPAYYVMKKLSIVTTTYKSEKYLDAYFNNITGLDGFADFQIVLVLNEPSSEELAIVESYKQKYSNNFKVVSVPRESIATSTNRGFGLAETEFVTIADVDDIKTKDCYSRQMATLENNPDADYTYGDFMIVPGQGIYKGLEIKTKEFKRELATRASIVGPNHFFRKEILKKSGMWDEQLRSGSDFDFQVRAAFNCNFKKTPGGLLLYYTRYENSNSASSGILQQVERTVIQLRYGIYDKLNYEYLPQALEYDIFNIYNLGEKRPIAEFVPNYKQYLQDCKKKFLRPGFRKNFINPIFFEKLALVAGGLVKNPVWTLKKIYKRFVK